VVQHLSPDANSSLDEILSRYTDLKVVTVTEGMALTAKTIFLIPPGKEIRLDGNLFVVSHLDRDQIARPIDVFFTSLSDNYGSRAIGIVLSGTGSDGSAGIRNINSVGGTTIVESPTTAQFDGMPKNAIATECVDYVLAADEISKWLKMQFDFPDEKIQPEEELDQEVLSGINLIFSLLSKRHEIDFSYYKPSTVARRIERRQQMNRHTSIQEYARQIEENVVELDLLYHDLLIGVTKFFRDTEGFNALERALQEKISALPRNECFRVWVSGCATGEEPYSISMLVFEIFTALDRSPNYKIFATDVHEGALQHASKALYTSESLEFVSNERRTKFFDQESDQYFRVNNNLRRNMVFARHNVIQDPPFTRMDVVTCRNLLIYFRNKAQQRSIASFHFALKRDGIMMLGASESPGTLASEFEVIDETWKVYSKVRDLPTMIHQTDQARPSSLESPRKLVNLLNRDRPESMSFTSLLEGYDLVLREFVSCGLLLESEKNIMHVFGNANRFLTNPSGRFSGNLMNFLEGDVKVSVAASLIRSSKEPGVEVRLQNLELPVGDETEIVDISVKALSGGSLKTFIWFVKIDPSSISAEELETENVIQIDRTSDAYASLESELDYTKESLSATIEELETTNEELQAANEQLVAANEELQSTNQELHSVNEELYSVNAENQRRIDDLEEMTDDVDNLLACTDIGTIFLDSKLSIRKFTQAASEYVKLLPSDIGRDISDFATHLDFPGLFNRIREVTKSGMPYTKEIDDDGQIVMVRILPYMSGKNIKGSIVNFIKLSDSSNANSS
jgi:two-component system CheB/CheR fusion protein